MRRGHYGVMAGAVMLAGCVSASVADQPKAASGTGFEIVTSLTTEVGARLAGTRKEAEARAWAIAKLKSLGFSNVREEPFTMPGWERGVETATLVSPTHQNLVIAGLGGTIGTPKGGLRAPLVFVASYDDLLKAPPGSLSGKIVYINDRMTRAKDGSGYRLAVRKRSRGAIEASKRGAVGVLIRSVGTDSHRFAHTGMMRYEPDVRKIPAAALSAPDADQVERLLTSGKNVIVSLNLQPKATPEVTSGNVVAEIPGVLKPEEIVLLGAHLDSWDQGTGAIDDGAGVAIVVAAALRAAGPDLKPKRTIRVVLYGAEEVGVHGGDAYAKAHAGEVSRHVMAVEADFGAGTPWRFDTNVPAADQPFYEDVARALAPMGIVRGATETTGGADIQPLQKLGVPVIGIDQDGTQYFDLHHTPDDTLDKIDPAALEQNVAVFARAVGMVADR